MNGPSKEEPPSKANEEQQALATFNHAAEELRFFKRQQWHVTNYALGAYGALVVVQRLVENPFMTRFAEVLVLAVLLVALVTLWSLEEALAKERSRLFRVRERHLPLIERVHTGDRRKYRSACSKWLALGLAKSRWRDNIAKFLALGPFVGLSAAVILGAVLAFIVIIVGPLPRVGG